MEIRRENIAFCCRDSISRRLASAWHPAFRGLLAARHLMAGWLHTGMGPSPNLLVRAVAQAFQRVSQTQDFLNRAALEGR